MADVTGLALLEMYERGELLKAADVNALIKAALRGMVAGGGMTFADEGAAAYGHPRFGTGRENKGHWFKNTNASSAPPGSVLRPTLAVSILDEIGHEIDKPNDDPGLYLVSDHTGSSIVQDAYGECCWAWQGAWCKYAGSAPSIGDRYVAEDDSWELAADVNGDFVFLGNVMDVGGTTYGKFVQVGAAGSSKILCVTNESLVHGGSCEVERVKREAGAWVRSGETFTAYDFFLNTGETLAVKTGVGVIDYEGIKVIDSMYCLPNDWIAD